MTPIKRKDLAITAAVVTGLCVIFYIGAALQRRGAQANDEVNTHNDSTYGYTVSYPRSWQPPPDKWLQVIKEIMTHRKLLFAAISPDQKLNLQISVLNDPPKDGETLDQLLERLQATSPLPRSNVSKTLIELGGNRASRQVADTTTQGFPARYVHVVFVRASHVWVIGIGGNRTSFQNNSESIDAILNSVKFDVAK